MPMRENGKRFYANCSVKILDTTSTVVPVFTDVQSTAEVDLSGGGWPYIRFDDAWEHKSVEV